MKKWKMWDRHQENVGQAPSSGNVGQAPSSQTYFSVILGFLSLSRCICFAVPSLIMGAAAIWLGLWVRKNYRSNSAGELANLWALLGIIFGSIGCVLGLIGVGMMIIGGMGAFVESMKQARP